MIHSPSYADIDGDECVLPPYAPIDIPDVFVVVHKIEDDDMLNKYRNYHGEVESCVLTNDTMGRMKFNVKFLRAAAMDRPDGTYVQVEMKRISGSG